MNTAQAQHKNPVFEGELIIEAALGSDALHDFSGQRVKYCLYGSLDHPLSVVMGGISAGAYVADTQSGSGETIKGWWDRSVGPGKTIDLNKHAVLGIEYVPNNDLAKQFFDQNHSVTTHDQARIVKYLLDSLKMEKLHAFIGSSYGGMVAMAFAELYPEALDKLVILCASAQANARTTAFRSIQRSILTLAAEDKKEDAVSLARSLGMIVYRSHKEFEQRFSNQAKRIDGQWTFPVTDYIYNRGKSLAQHFSPQRFSLLSESCDLHRVKPGHITADTLLIGFDSDDIVKPEEIIHLSEHLGGTAQYRIMQSIYGHDAFIVEQHRFANDISEHLNSP